MDARADEKRDEAIAKLKKLLPTVSEGPQKAELIFRLAEMYWGKSKFKHLLAMRQWDDALEAWHGGGNKGPQPKLEDTADLDQAELFKREALKLYEKILASYPDYERKDEVLYNLGSSYYESGQKEEGVGMYWKLIKQFPDSPYTADAWLQLGEHFFNANKLTQAIKAYTKAAETERPRIYSYALYKLAWCDYNLQEWDKALDKFRQVIAYAKKQREGAELEGRDKIQLLEEALNDMVRAYSHLDAIEDAVEFYWTEVGKDPAYRYLRKLAKLYNNEGKYALEIKLYERLNKDYPYRPEAPENQTAIMEAYAQLNRTDDVRREVRRLIDLYSPNGLWAKQNASNQEVLTRAFDEVEQRLAALVTEKHREAQSTKLVETYMLARDIYKEYLEKFTNTINSYKFRFFYAEILFELKEFEPAAEQYGLVVAADKKGEFVKPAAYNAILAWEKVASGAKETLGKKIEEKGKYKSKGTLAKLEKIEELKKGGSYEPEELTAVEKRLADACDLFVDVAPADEEVVKVKFKSARLYYIHNRFEEAAQRFGEIIDRWPNDPLGRLAAESILMSWNVRSDWSNLNKWSRKFRDNGKLMGDKAFAQRVDEFVEGSSFNEILFVFEPKEKPLEIADRYAGFVKEFPKSKFVLVGLYNAVVNYDKANFLEKSITFADKTLKDYKDFKLTDADRKKGESEGAKVPAPEEIREKVLYLMASFKERLAEFADAAAYYEQYVSEFPKGESRADALFNSAVLREGLGDFDKAIANFTAYVKAFPQKKDVANVQWRIGLIHEKKKDYKAMQSHFGEFAKIARDDPARQLCADYKVVQALLKQNKEKEAKAGYEGLIQSFKKLPEADRAKPCPLEAVASASFAMIEPAFQEYMALTLKGSESEMAKKLTKKIEQVGQLEGRYTEVLGIGQGDYGIASLYRIGVIYQHLAKEMFSTPCPKRLDADQCMIYESELQNTAFPLEEKAIEAFDKALAKAYELGLYNDWLAKAQEALKTYEPARFPEIREYELIASEKVFEVPSLVEARP